jgi:hypothetical protein
VTTARPYKDQFEVSGSCYKPPSVGRTKSVIERISFSRCSFDIGFPSRVSTTADFTAASRLSMSASPTASVVFLHDSSSRPRSRSIRSASIMREEFVQA